MLTMDSGMLMGIFLWPLIDIKTAYAIEIGRSSRAIFSRADLVSILVCPMAVGEKDYRED